MKNLSRNPVRTVGEFVNENIDYFRTAYSESNENCITDENFEDFDDKIYKEYAEDNKEITKEIMYNCYMESICEC